MAVFRSKIAVITGAGSGIGRALALTLANRGAHLALSDIDAESLAETARSAESRGISVLTETLDVADRAAFMAHRDRVLDELGGAHFVFNNAGVALVQNIADATPENMRWIVDINFWGVVNGTQAFLPHFLEQRAGHVTNISSVFGLMAVPGQAFYNATKFAVRGFTEALRMELRGTGVRASCVHPGGIKTNIARAARVFGTGHGPSSSAEAGKLFEKMARTSPEKAADIIVRGVEQGRERILVGPDAWVIDRMVRLFPERYVEIVRRVMPG